MERVCLLCSFLLSVLLKLIFFKKKNRQNKKKIQNLCACVFRNQEAWVLDQARIKNSKTIMEPCCDVWNLIEDRDVLSNERSILIEADLGKLDDICVMSSSRKRQRRYKTSKSESEEDDQEMDVALLENDATPNQTELDRAEEDATTRICMRKAHASQSASMTEWVVAKELENIANSILECEAYEMQTTGKSSWTLKKIAYQVRELKQILFVQCRILIDPKLLYSFADRLFCGKRSHLRNSFLCQFINK